jgi:Mn2+/Fe2+ NRAMP family transporter
VALFQAQPEGLGLFLRPPALSITYVGRLHCVLSALSDTKIAASSGGYESSISPRYFWQVLEKNMNIKSPWTSFHGIATLIVTVAAIIFVLTEHLDHLLEYFPFLIILLCPLMHIFMHKGHADKSGNHHREQELEEAYRKGLKEGRKSKEKLEGE